MVAVVRVRFDGGASGALATPTPNLQWELSGDERDWIQAKFEVKITYGDGSDAVVSQNSSNSTHVEWPGRPLISKELVTVSVRVVGEDGTESPWSEPFSMRVGVLENEWSTPFIMQTNQFVYSHEEKNSPEVLFRSPEFKVNAKKGVKAATIFSTALGVYELEINGEIADKTFLEPGWTSYKHRLLHQVYDVTSLLSEVNVIGARVASGWFSGFLGFLGGNSNIYGTEKALSLMLCVEYRDGSIDVVETSESWLATEGPIVSAQLYTGEAYDARREILNWSRPGTAHSSWSPTHIIPNPCARIAPKSFGYTRSWCTLDCKEIIITPQGKTVLDFGQNAVGFAHMKPVKATRGHKVTLRHAEVIEDGELGTRPLREAKAVDCYTFKGLAEGEEYTPRFTFHGCRYVEVDGYPGTLTKDSFEFVVISSDIDQVGFFECSNPMINKLHENVFHSTRGNFVSLPTDCPQRDERMGWLGDIALYAPTAMSMFDSYNFLKSWMEDVKYEQSANGGFPGAICPDIMRTYDHTWDNYYFAIWADATIIVPWRLYEYTGNTDVLVAQYDSMKTWYEYIPKIPGKLRWAKVDQQLGDWLDPTAPPELPEKAMTDAYMVADAFLYLVIKQMAATSGILGKKEDEKYFKLCAEKCKRDYQDEYVTHTGRLVCESQTAYALTICFGLYDAPQLTYMGERLSKLVSANDFKIGTGFAGTPFITEALSLSGHTEDAYKMLAAKECPSWMYPITMGATTVWERWDSMLPNGKINPGMMTSFNHYALGAVALWMHERIGGLRLGSAGYKSVTFKPLPGGDIEWATMRHRSPLGWFESNWNLVDGSFKYKVKVPPNARATVELPNGEKHDVGSGTYHF